MLLGHDFGTAGAGESGNYGTIGAVDGYGDSPHVFPELTVFEGIAVGPGDLEIGLEGLDGCDGVGCELTEMGMALVEATAFHRVHEGEDDLARGAGVGGPGETG